MNWKNTMNSSFLLQLTILVCIFQLGITLTCFICDTELNSSCLKINKDSKLKPQECTIDAINNHLMTSLGRLGVIPIISPQFDNYDENNTDALQFQCVKIIATEADGRRIIHRTCQRKEPESCKIIENRVWEEKKSMKIVECNICDNKNNCNGAATNHFPIVLFVGSLFIVSSFAFLSSKLK